MDDLIKYIMMIITVLNSLIYAEVKVVIDQLSILTRNKKNKETAAKSEIQLQEIFFSN